MGGIRVAIIGAGVAGLQTARALQKQGTNFRVFEESDEVGGVWRTNYSGYRLQVPWNVYEFPEYPYPKEIGLGFLEFPEGERVQAYIRGYVDHFKLRPQITCKTKLEHLVRKDDAGKETGWRVKWSDSNTGSLHEEEFDYVVMASGRYSHPSLPAQYKGVEKYEGQLVTARFLEDPATLEGKSVLILGGGKTALDISDLSAAHAAETTQLFRRAHWAVPQFVFGFLPATWIAFNRIGTFFLPAYYEQTPSHAIFHRLAQPLKAFWWAFTKWAVTTTFGLKGDLIPDAGFVEDQYVGGLLTQRRHYDLIRAGKIKAIRGDVERFTADGVVTTDGQELGPFDVIVAATGYAHDYSYFEPEVLKRLGVEEDGLWLYRNILSPSVPGVAFIGSEATTFSNLLTYGIQAEWLARVLTGKVVLPTREDQEDDIAANKEWKRSWVPPSNWRSTAIQLHQTYYHDQLLKDCGFSEHRRGWNVLGEYLQPLAGRTYRSFFQAAELEAQGRAPSRHAGPAPVQRPHNRTAAITPQVDVPYGGIPVEKLFDLRTNGLAAEAKGTSGAEHGTITQFNGRSHGTVVA